MTSRHRTLDGSRITGPSELLQAVPYLLGFHPVGSLVLIGLRDTRLVVTARLDLDDACFDAVAHAVAAMARGGSTSFVAVVYDDDALLPGTGELPWAELAGTVGDVVELVGAELRDVLLVSGQRWWSFECANHECCPPGGRELPDDVRAALIPALAAAENAAVQQTVAGQGRRWEVSVKRELFRAARAADEIGWTGVPDEPAARLAAGLAVTAVRDAVWLAIDGGRLDGRPLWRDLARRAPVPYDAAALFLYGWASWRAGDGALARIAADRALASDAGYTAAGLLQSAVVSGLDPRRLPRLRMPRQATPPGQVARASG